MATKKTSTTKTAKTTKSMKQELFSKSLECYGVTKVITIASVSASIAMASIAMLVNTIPNDPQN